MMDMSTPHVDRLMCLKKGIGFGPWMPFLHLALNGWKLQQWKCNRIKLVVTL